MCYTLATLTVIVLQDNSVPAAKTSFGGNFTTTEVNTGFKWTDNRDIYKKTISLGALPNNTTKLVAHGITSLLRVLQLEGAATDGTRHHILPIVANTSNTAALRVSVTSTDIDLSSNANWSTYTTAHVTLFYTKT